MYNDIGIPEIPEEFRQEAEQRQQRFGTHPWAHKSVEDKKDEDIVIHLRAVIQTQSGLEVFKYIRSLCYVDQDIAEFNFEGEPNMAAMMRISALQKFWFNLKPLLMRASREHLIMIEIPPEQEIK